MLMCSTFIQSDSDWLQPEGTNFYEFLSLLSPKTHQPGVVCIFLHRLQLVLPVQQQLEERVSTEQRGHLGERH